MLGLMKSHGVPTILVLDDSAAIRLLVRRTLEARPSRVIEASGADEAWALMAVERPSLVLMEQRLAGSDPLEIPRALRRDRRLAGTRVLVLTTMAGEEGRRRALEAGADVVMSKPFHPAELLAAVDFLLAPGRGRRQQAYGPAP